MGEQTNRHRHRHGHRHTHRRTPTEILKQRAYIMGERQYSPLSSAVIDYTIIVTNAVTIIIICIIITSYIILFLLLENIFF